MAVTPIDATGARSELSGSVHAAAGDAKAVATLPALDAGAVSFALAALVGPDSHPLTGQVDSTITGEPSTTVSSTTAPAAASNSPIITIPTPAPESIAEKHGGVLDRVDLALAVAVRLVSHDPRRGRHPAELRLGLVRRRHTSSPETNPRHTCRAWTRQPTWELRRRVFRDGVPELRARQGAPRRGARGGVTGFHVLAFPPGSRGGVRSTCSMSR